MQRGRHGARGTYAKSGEGLNAALGSECSTTVNSQQLMAQRPAPSPLPSTGLHHQSHVVSRVGNTYGYVHHNATAQDTCCFHSLRPAPPTSSLLDSLLHPLCSDNNNRYAYGQHATKQAGRCAWKRRQQRLIAHCFGAHAPAARGAPRRRRTNRTPLPHSALPSHYSALLQLTTSLEKGCRPVALNAAAAAEQ